MNGDRYANQPFLRLLECYVLMAAEQLDPDQAGALTAMEPQLRTTYRTVGTWYEIVAEQMEFSEEVPSALKDLWQRQVAGQDDNGEPTDPMIWAQQVVDANFT